MFAPPPMKTADKACTFLFCYVWFRKESTLTRVAVYIEGQGENELDASSRAEAVLRLLDQEWFSPYGLQRA